MRTFPDAATNASTTPRTSPSHLATKLSHSDTSLARRASGRTWRAPRASASARSGWASSSRTGPEFRFQRFGAITSGRVGYEIWRASGAATLKKHRIVGRGTRFESQFGAEEHWSKKVTGGFFGQGPWVSVQINGDWETVRVDTLGDGSYGEYIMTLENSFSEPLFKATHFHWYTMLTQGYGRVRSYGKRVVSNMWSNVEFSNQVGEGRTEGVYGNTRFLTQLRTGFTITACGQTRMVNSIQSDVEMTIDRPFTLGNREFLPAPGSTATADDLYVRGLTRLMPLWPRGVTVQIIVTDDGLDSQVQVPRLVEDVQAHGRRDDNSADDSCTDDDITNARGLRHRHEARRVDAAQGQGAAEGVWRVRQVEQVRDGRVRGRTTRGGSRSLTSGRSTSRISKIASIGSPPRASVSSPTTTPTRPCATTTASACPSPRTPPPSRRRNADRSSPRPAWCTTTGRRRSEFKLSAEQDPYDGNRNARFTVDVEAGDIVRLLVDPADDTTWKDIRVTRIVSDTVLISDFPTDVFGAGASP